MLPSSCARTWQSLFAPPRGQPPRARAGPPASVAHELAHHLLLMSTFGGNADGIKCRCHSSSAFVIGKQKCWFERCCGAVGIALALKLQSELLTGRHDPVTSCLRLRDRKGRFYRTLASSANEPNIDILPHSRSGWPTQAVRSCNWALPTLTFLTLINTLRWFVI